MTDTNDSDLDDLLPDDLKKGAAKPLKRTKKQSALAARKAAEKQAADDLAVQQDAAKAQAARLAQIVNLHIAGFSLADIGASIGATEDEVDRMLAQETQRYVRNQPALRTFVRNFVSGEFVKMLEVNAPAALDPHHAQKLEHQDRNIRILERIARLHGAEAPTQAEVKVDAMPETVEKVVNAIASAQGFGYDANIFDGIVDADVVEDMVDESQKALEQSSDAVEDEQPEDEEL